MTVRDFCLNKTNAHELVVIRDAGWIVASVWIDYEDIFLIPDRVKEKVIRNDSWGTLNIVTKHGDELEVPCHYLDIWFKWIQKSKGSGNLFPLPLLCLKKYTQFLGLSLL